MLFPWKYKVQWYNDDLCVCVTQTKEEMVGTVEAVQALQIQNGHLQKSKEGYHAKCLELDRLRKEGAPQKELEKVSHQMFSFHFNIDQEYGKDETIDVN